jgi:hypothetical protein
VLATYQEIRDRIYELARQHDLRPDWVESTKNARYLLLYDRSRVVVARAAVPVRHGAPGVLEELERQLAPVFGKDWMK